MLDTQAIACYSNIIQAREHSFLSPVFSFSRKFMTLALKVETRNKVNAMCAFAQPYLSQMLEKYMGKKIVKFTPYSGFTTALKKEIQEFQDKLAKDKFRLVFTFNFSSVSCEIDTTYRVDGSSVEYVKQYFFICDFDANTGVLTKKYDSNIFRTDYTEEEVTSVRKQIDELEKQVSDLKSQIREFIR
jgi:hypothetical protein